MDQEILDMAVILTGAAEDRQVLLTALCAAARQRWQARLREGVAAEDCGQAFVCAAAFFRIASAEIISNGIFLWPIRKFLLLRSV